MPEDYTVQPGDCISSIAFERGFFWQTLWNDGGNAKLKELRKDPNVLQEGDIVHIPDLTLKQESGATENKHKFKLKGVPAKLKLRLMQPKPPKDKGDSASSASSSPSPGGGGAGDNSTSDLADPDYEQTAEEDEPIKNAPYVLEVDGVIVDQGNTDGDGYVKITIKPDAREGRLTVHKSQPEERIFMLDLGVMDPVDEVSGVRKRLANLGFFCAPDGPADADDLVIALRHFQEGNSLNVTGEIDDPTKSKLKELHGC